MNKKYITPATEVVNLNVQQMLAASPNVTVSTNKNDKVDAGGFDTRQHQGVGSGLWSDMK